MELRRKVGFAVLTVLHQVSYADFYILGFLHFCKRIDEAVFERVLEGRPALGNLYEAGGQYLARDD